MKCYIIYNDTHYKVNKLSEEMLSIFEDKLVKASKTYSYSFLLAKTFVITETQHLSIVKHIIDNSNLKGEKLRDFTYEYTNLCILPQNMFRVKKLYGYRPLKFCVMDKGITTTITLQVKGLE
jgi:hypothetical protein